MTLSEYIADRIFSEGCEPLRPGNKGIVQRIEFKGGTWPSAETSLGGLCKSALARCVAKYLSDSGVSDNQQAQAAGEDE